MGMRALERFSALKACASRIQCNTNDFGFIPQVQVPVPPRTPSTTMSDNNGKSATPIAERCPI